MGMRQVRAAQQTVGNNWKYPEGGVNNTNSGVKIGNYYQV